MTRVGRHGKVASLHRQNIAIRAAGGHQVAMPRRSPLDDREKAAFAWARFRRLMGFMFLVTVAVVVIAVVLLYREVGAISIHFFIATALGIGLMMLLMSALMGLVFLSSGTGHDDSVTDLSEDEEEGDR